MSILLFKSNKGYIQILTYLFFSISIFGQKVNKPNKIGLTKEFSGRVTSYYQYDGDRFFTIKDAAGYEIELYFNAGSCHGDGDPFYIETEINAKLLERIENLHGDNKEKITVKVTAKSTFGLFCGNCDDCEKNKQIIWRPVKVIEIK